MTENYILLTPDRSWDNLDANASKVMEIKVQYVKGYNSRD